MLFSYYFFLLRIKTGVDSHPCFYLLPLLCNSKNHRQSRACTQRERVKTLKIGLSAGNQRLIYLIKIISVGSSETKRRALTLAFLPFAFALQ
jgi:hypothetical protein